MSPLAFGVDLWPCAPQAAAFRALPCCRNFALGMTRLEIVGRAVLTYESLHAADASLQNCCSGRGSVSR